MTKELEGNLQVRAFEQAGPTVQTRPFEIESYGIKQIKELISRGRSTNSSMLLPLQQRNPPEDRPMSDVSSARMIVLGHL